MISYISQDALWEAETPPGLGASIGRESIDNSDTNAAQREQEFPAESEQESLRHVKHNGSFVFLSVYVCVSGDFNGSS